MLEFNEITWTCPECGEELIECIGSYGDESYDGLKCPNGCNLMYSFGG